MVSSRSAADSGLVRIPRRPEDVTPSWMCDALGVGVSDVSIYETIGGTATKIMLNVEYDGPSELPPSFCLKAGMGDHAPFMAQVGIYATEAQFFRDERAHTSVRVPQVFWADIDDEQFGAVLMEDLSRPTVRFCSARTPLSADEVSSVLDNIALLHIGRWNSPWLETADWLEHFASPHSKGRSYFSMLGPEVVDSFIDQRRDLLPSELTDAQTCLDLFWGFVSRSEEGPQTLLHGDLHAGNVYFDGQQSAICDWQVLGRGSPAFDLAYLIGSAMTTADRRDSERDLLRQYLAQLEAADIEGVPGFDELWRLYRIHMAYGFFAWLTNPEAFQEGDIIAEVVTRMGAAVIDLDTLDAVGSP